MKCWYCEKRDAERKPPSIYCTECRLDMVANKKFSVLTYPTSKYYLPGTDGFGKTQLDYFMEMGEEKYNHWLKSGLIPYPPIKIK